MNISDDVTITIPLKEALLHFNFVAGILYKDATDKNKGWVPHFTGNYYACDCSEYNLTTKQATGNCYPKLPDDLGEAIEII